MSDLGRVSMRYGESSLLFEEVKHVLLPHTAVFPSHAGGCKHAGWGPQAMDITAQGSRLVRAGHDGLQPGEADGVCSSFQFLSVSAMHSRHSVWRLYFVSIGHVLSL